MAPSNTPVRTVEELHDGLTYIHEALASDYRDLVEFTQRARMADEGVKPDDLLRVTNNLAEHVSAAANLISQPQGTDETTGIPNNAPSTGAAASLPDVPPEHNDNQPAVADETESAPSTSGTDEGDEAK